MNVKRLMRCVQRGLLLLAVVTATSAWASYSQVYFFGDSLTDTGNLYDSSGIPVSPPYYQGGFSNGPLWSTLFASALGLTATPSLQGGTNYAWAGATVIDYGRPQPVLPVQLGQYLATHGGAADPEALYVIMGGANDVNDASLNPASATTNIIAAANAVNNMVHTLYSAGARNILVGNIPNVGLTPRAAAAGPTAVAFASMLSQTFDTTLDNLLAVTRATSAQLDLDLLNMYTLLNSAIAQPASYGFSNVSDACKDGALGAPGNVCATPDSYLFWDSFHPSERAQALIAQTALVAIPEPPVLLLVVSALFCLLGFLPVVRRRQRHYAPLVSYT